MQVVLYNGHKVVVVVVVLNFLRISDTNTCFYKLNTFPVCRFNGLRGSRIWLLDSENSTVDDAAALQLISGENVCCEIRICRRLVPRTP